jgi:hypothetical protein
MLGSDRILTRIEHDILASLEIYGRDRQAHGARIQQFEVNEPR